MLNYTVLQGRLTDDPDFEVVNSRELCKFSIAVPDDYNKDYTHFFDIVAWGKPAEVVANHFNKGKEIIVEGKLKHERWEHEGKKRSKVTVTMQRFHFAGKKGE